MAFDLSQWLIWIGHAVLSNLIVASLLAIVATIVGWKLRRPAIAHGLWVLVLVKLVTPPIVTLPVPIPEWLDFAYVSRVIEQSSPAFLSTKVTNEDDLDSVVVVAEKSPSIDKKPPPSVHPNQMHPGSVFLYVLKVTVQIVLVLWLCIAVTLVIRSLLRSIRFGRVLEAEGFERADATRLGLQMAEASGIPNCPRIRLVSASLSPMLFGFSRWATIVLPSRLWDELNDSQRRAMLAHELSHYQRCDHWVRGLELIAGCLYFWFPLVRVARTQIERMEETCCDLNAVDALENDRRLYAESLLHVVDYISQRGGRMPGLASGMRPTITLEERLRSIMNDQSTGRMSHRHRSVLGLVGLSVVLIHPWASPSSSGTQSLNSNSIDSPTQVNSIPPQENQIRVHGLQFEKLPQEPRGWWSDSGGEIAVRTFTLPIGEKMHLSFNPGVFIDIVFENGASHRLAESEPTAMVTLQSGARLIVGNRKGDIRLWDLATQQSTPWIGHNDGPITSLCYHPKFGLLSGDGNGQLLLWEIESGAVLNSWSLQKKPIQSVRCDIDGDEVAILFGEWKHQEEHSSIVFMNPLQSAVTGTFDLPVSFATMFEREGAWHSVDWNGNVYQVPLQHMTGMIPKTDVSGFVFSQDAKIPEVKPIPIEALNIPSFFFQ